MSTVITKATISGSELPLGPRYGYCVDSADNTLNLVSMTQYGMLQRQPIAPFPPTSFSLNLGGLFFPEVPYALAFPDPPLDAFAFNVTQFSPTTLHTYSTGIVVTGGFMNGADSFMIGKATYDNTVLLGEYDAGAPTLLCAYGVGLGKDAIGNPKFYFRSWAGHTVTVDSDKCEVDGTLGVQCFGFGYDPLAYVLHILINKTTGTVAHMTGQWTGISGYYNLYIPPGGEIKQFANMYYICSDGNGALFLYSIVAGGTLLTELTPGSYDPDLPAVFMGLV